MKIFRLFFIIGLCVSAVLACKKNIIQEPQSKESDNFLQQSQKKEKIRHEEEINYLKSWVKNNPKYNFKFTQYGFWIDSTSLSSMDNTYIEELDTIQYRKQIKNLDKETIYSFEDNDTQYMVMGKSSEIRGVEKALRMLSEKSSSTLLLPSFMAYGLYGDERKINSHQPIIVELKVLKVN